jgi:hypothetical protein
MGTLDEYAEYWRRVTRRVKKGQAEYGDASFLSSPVELLDELQQEVEDIAGWGYILWRRLERAKQLLLRDHSRAIFDECDDEEEDGDD